MTSCTVETINAIWTALAYLIPAMVVLVGARKASKWPAYEDGSRGACVVALIAVAGGLMIGFHNYGQDSFRYVVAETQGYECVYDNHGNVKVVRPGDTPATGGTEKK